MSNHFSIVNFRHPDSLDAGSLVSKYAIEAGAKVDVITSQKDETFSDFNYGNVDWRNILQHKHWLILSSTTVLEGNSPSSAWGASMIFGELEGTKTVMIVDMPKDNDKITEMWGQIVTRIRQIHILFFTKEALNIISALENISTSSLLSDIRTKGLVPIVCSYDEIGNIAKIAHSSGELSIQSECQLTYYSWLANFIFRLSSTNSNKSEIRHAASYTDNSKIAFN